MSEDFSFFLSDLISYTLNGVAQGSVYALMALGYTMVYGIIKLINFAHGEFLMLGAFIGFFCLSMGMPPWIAVLLASCGAGIIAVIVEYLAYRPLRHAGRIPPLVTALGVSLFFQYSGQLLLGAAPRRFPEIVSVKTWMWNDIAINNIQLIIMGSALSLMIFLWWLVTKTAIGRAMRAVSFNHDIAELMGVNTNKVIGFTFFIGASFAGFSGVLIGIYYNTIDPMMGMIPGIKSFVAAVLGGIGVIPGAALGGLLLGIAENLVVGLWVSTYRDAIAFAILILILLFRPAGLLGKNTKEKI